MPTKILTVVRHFADYQRGARITDPATVAKILASHNVSKVVASYLPDDSKFSAQKP